MSFLAVSYTIWLIIYWPLFLRHLVFSNAFGLSHSLHELDNDHRWSQVAFARVWWLLEVRSHQISKIYFNLPRFFPALNNHATILHSLFRPIGVTVILLHLLFVGSFCIIQYLQFSLLYFNFYCFYQTSLVVFYVPWQLKLISCLAIFDSVFCRLTLFVWFLFSSVMSFFFY